MVDNPNDETELRRLRARFGWPEGKAIGDLVARGNLILEDRQFLQQHGRLHGI